MEYFYLTSSPQTALHAIECGVDRIFIDLEQHGKLERQGHLDSFISQHSISHIVPVKKAIGDAHLLVRINPIFEGSKAEIEEVIKGGANTIMLPMFKNCKEVSTFLNFVDGRCKTCLLLETSEALVNLDEILEVEGNRLNEIHIGLNDLHLSMGLKFMFELLSSGLVEFIIDKIKPFKNIRYGIGGIAPIGKGAVPAELILGEYIRLGSQFSILSRAFQHSSNDVNAIKNMDLKAEIIKLRKTEHYFENSTYETVLNNKKEFQKSVRSFVQKK